MARSTNFRYGSIITSGKDEQEVDRNIKDAILTSFEIPSAYSADAKLYKKPVADNLLMTTRHSGSILGGIEKQSQYALA